ncbi:MAG TPA: lysophospholipid acyltransferase family protein [Phycisphaerales bacterium]|nr:lysophospholipid acyltransferase family protein [Phycisphaerales bacterium]
MSLRMTAKLTDANSISIAGAYDARFVNFFAWYVRRMFRKRFHAFRIAGGTRGVLGELDGHAGPAIVVMNHGSWWDPLVALMVGRALCPSRTGCAPMDARELAKFGMLRKLGIFGIDPDDARSLPAMTRYVLERFERERRGTLWITPQGRFMDVREAIALRPGAAAIAARAKNVRVVSLAIEYGFWVDQKPEVFVRLERVSLPGEASASTAHWHAAMTKAMQSNGDALAGLVRARDAAGFEALWAEESGKDGSVHPVMDWWLRLRGKRVALTDRTR